MRIKRIAALTAAIALPLSGFAAVASGLVNSGTAGAVSPPINCTVAGSVTFQAPGLSKNGVVGTAKTSTSTTTASTLGCGTSSGSTAGKAITTKTTKCTGTNAPVPGCAKGLTNWDSTSSFVGTGVASIQKTFKKVTFVLAGAAAGTYSGKTTGVTVAACASGELGFKITGTVKGPKGSTYSAFNLSVCLGPDSGTGTTNAFGTDLGATNSNPAIVIASAGYAADSSLSIS